MISFGAMSGKPLVISPANLLFKTATVKGFWGAKRTETTSREEMGRMIGELVRLVATGALKLDVEAAFDIARGRSGSGRERQAGAQWQDRADGIT